MMTLETASILVIDEERIIREGCARLLKKAGHEVFTAVNETTALDLLKKHKFHIVLLDMKMPQMSGRTFLNLIRQEYSNLVILVMTGYAQIESAVEAMKNGAYDLLLKPFSADALRIAVHRGLEHLRLNLEAEELRLKQARSLRDIANEQSRVRTIINSMAAGILVTDNEKNLVLFNPIARQMLQMAEANPVNRPVAQVVKQEKLLEMIDRLFAGKEEFTALEQEIQIGEDLWLRARAAPVCDTHGLIMGAVTVLQDVTHMKEMDRMKSEFVGMVSHELKAPLAAIQQQIEVLLSGLAGQINEKQSHFLTRAQIRAQGLIDLINQLLDLSRIEAGRIVSQQEPLDLAPLIFQVVEFLRPQAEAKNQHLTCLLPKSLPLISADPENMDEVFVNLISNAIKYTPEGGLIEIKSEVVEDFLRVAVADNGYGIAKEDVHRIFDKFYRVKTDKTKSIDGTGLGLPIVLGIVEAHLGKIKVDSRLGRGTVFKVELPLLARQPVDPAAQPN